MRIRFLKWHGILCKEPFSTGRRVLYVCLFILTSAGKESGLYTHAFLCPKLLLKRLFHKRRDQLGIVAVILGYFLDNA